MIDIVGARPHVWRIAIFVIGLLTLFLFFDPIGFASSSMDSIANRGPGNADTLTHIVMFQFKRDAEPAAIDVACARMMSLKDNCVAQNSKFPYIKSITGGRDNSNEKLQHGATHAFVIQFANADDRDYYVERDPAHQAFKQEIESLVEKTTVLDYTNGKFS
ncbi:stress responsive A/B barrel domain-containing protein [Chaetomium sp. MPI-CAGE-AT-0009]|nr:stress responsive A/B barrel domain-containing protein [Chaetomium sp. MPI-CAGE-AT-0009]